MSKVLDKYFSRFFEKHGKNKGLKLLIDCIINKKYLNKNNYKLKNYNNQFIYFWSNATKEKEKSKKKSYYFLSNLNHIKDTIEYDDIIYNSVEHAYQAQKFIKSQRERFSINGDLGGWDGFKFFVKEEEIIKKINFWIKKDNIGIIAKMASNEKYDKKTKLIRDPNFVESVN